MEKANALLIGGQVYSKRMASGGSWVLAAKFVGLIAAVASTTLLARLLQPHELGSYYIAFSLIMMATLAGPLGLNRAVVKLTADNLALGRPARAKGDLRKMLFLGDLAVAIMIVLAVVFRYSPWGNSLTGSIPLGISVAGTGLAAFFMTASTLRGEAFLGMKDYRNAVLHRSMLQNILYIFALTCVWLVFRKSDLSTVILLLGAACAIDYLIASFKIRRWMKSSPDAISPDSGVERGLYQVLRVSLPLWIATLASFVYSQSSLWLIDWQTIAQEVALFGLAARITQLLFRFPSNLINTIIPPYIAGFYARQEKEKLQVMLRGSATVASVSTLMMLAGFWVFGKPVLAFVFGDFYQNAYPYVLILGIGELVNAWAGAIGETLMMTDYQRGLMFISLVNCALAFLMGWYFVQWWGGIGGAWSRAIVLSLYNIMMVIFFYTKTGLRTNASLFWLSKRLFTKRAN